jgi:hypothetical protein
MKADLEQLEQDVESKSMIIFVWPHYSKDTPCIFCSLIFYYSAPIIILIPIVSQLNSSQAHLFLFSTSLKYYIPICIIVYQMVPFLQVS